MMFIAPNVCSACLQNFVWGTLPCPCHTVISICWPNEQNHGAICSEFLESFYKSKGFILQTTGFVIGEHLEIMGWQ